MGIFKPISFQVLQRQDPDLTSLCSPVLAQYWGLSKCFSHTFWLITFQDLLWALTWPCTVAHKVNKCLSLWDTDCPQRLPSTAKSRSSNSPGSLPSPEAPGTYLSPTRILIAALPWPHCSDPPASHHNLCCLPSARRNCHCQLSILYVTFSWCFTYIFFNSSSWQTLLWRWVNWGSEKINHFPWSHREQTVSWGIESRSVCRWAIPLSWHHTALIIQDENNNNKILYHFPCILVSWYTLLNGLQ